MSTIPLVLAALASVAEATVDDDWLVINGPVGSVTTTKANFVLFGDADVTGVRALDSLAEGTTSEQYVVPWTVSAFIPGTDQAVVDALALDMYAALEVAIREYPGATPLGVAGVVKALPIGTFTLKRTADRSGDAEFRYAAVSSGVDIYAQNT